MDSRQSHDGCRVTMQRHSRRLVTGQKTGQSNTTITPEMQAAQWRPGQSGNPSGRPHKTPFTAALLRIVEKKIANDPDGRALLDGIAQQLVAKASKGDLASIRELADRIEGKPQQQVTVRGEGGGAIPFVNVSPAENERRIAELLAKAGALGDGQIADWFKPAGEKTMTPEDCRNSRTRKRRRGRRRRPCHSSMGPTRVVANVGDCCTEWPRNSHPGYDKQQ
jgi:hypothetical protein